MVVLRFENIGENQEVVCKSVENCSKNEQKVTQGEDSMFRSHYRVAVETWNDNGKLISVRTLSKHFDTIQKASCFADEVELERCQSVVVQHNKDDLTVEIFESTRRYYLCAALMHKVIEPRKWYRADCDEDATLMLGDLVVTGTVKDAGGGGIFFEPEIAYINGYMTDDVGDELQNGDTVTINFRGKDHSSTICWQGKSPRHGCYGIGISFKSPVMLPDLCRVVAA